MKILIEGSVADDYPIDWETGNAGTVGICVDDDSLPGLYVVEFIAYQGDDQEKRISLQFDQSELLGLIRQINQHLTAKLAN